MVGTSMVGVLVKSVIRLYGVILAVRNGIKFKPKNSTANIVLPC